MTARKHKDLIVFWACNKNSRVWSSHSADGCSPSVNGANGLWSRVIYPDWHPSCLYAITNTTFEENLFKCWREGKTLEYLDPDTTCEYEDKWVELPKEAIPEFHKYTYRLKVEKSPYDLAKEEADKQKESAKPLDIYKWHWGTGERFTIESEEVWDYGYYSDCRNKGVFCKKEGVEMAYSSHQLYKKKL